MSVKMILATGQNYELGKDNRLLWNIPDDLKYFKEQTEFFNVVMGSNTFESLPLVDGLPNRINYVVTKDITKQLEGNKVRFTSLDSIAYIMFKMGKYEDYWVIGGASIYDQLIDYVDEVHWTRVLETYPEADTYLSQKVIDEVGSNFKHESIKCCIDSQSDVQYRIEVLKRIK